MKSLIIIPSLSSGLASFLSDLDGGPSSIKNSARRTADTILQLMQTTKKHKNVRKQQSQAVSFHYDLEKTPTMRGTLYVLEVS